MFDGVSERIRGALTVVDGVLEVLLVDDGVGELTRAAVFVDDGEGLCKSENAGCDCDAVGDGDMGIGTVELGVPDTVRVVVVLLDGVLDAVSVSVADGVCSGVTDAVRDSVLDGVLDAVDD